MTEKLKNAGMMEHFGAEGSKFKSNFAQGSAGFKKEAGFDFPIGNASLGRLNKSGLGAGGVLKDKGRTVNQPQVLSGSAGAEEDWRVKLSLPPAAGGFYLDSPLMAPLMATGGLMWPITPTIIIQHSANYTPQEPVHNNYPYYAYNNSRVDAMSIIGNFPVQNSEEGKYWLAALHFLRSVSKMFFGPGGGSQGNPPQILRLNGYGEHIFKDVPVIVEQVTVELRESVDYIAVTTTEPPKPNPNKKGKGPSRKNQRLSKNKNYKPPTSHITRVPTDSVFTVLVQPVYSRKRVAKYFNLKDFSSGKLAKKGFI